MANSDERTLVSFDWAMKHILRDKANFDVLEGFLSVLLKEDVTVTGLLEREGNQQSSSDKFNRVDLMVEDSNGVGMIIEIQYSYFSSYLRRILWGVAKLITESLELGDDYNKVKKVISISVLYFPFSDVGDDDRDAQDDDYVYYGGTEFYGLHTGRRLSVRQDTLRRYTKNKKIGKKGEEEQTLPEEDDWGRQSVQCEHNIFPEFYLIEVNRFPSEVKDALDEWIYFFKHSEILDEFKSAHIEAARDKLRVMKMTPDEKKAYERFWSSRAIYRDEIESAKNDGRAEGLEEGRAEGLEEGRAEGLEEGRAEGLEEGQLKNQQEVARQMLMHGEPLDKISLYSGLSEDEIHSLSSA
ncbi:MAG: PD-(D/E)XK nuclease family transposase [Chloroflexota bacterium]